MVSIDDKGGAVVGSNVGTDTRRSEVISVSADYNSYSETGFALVKADPRAVALQCKDTLKDLFHPW